MSMTHGAAPADAGAPAAPANADAAAAAAAAAAATPTPGAPAAAPAPAAPGAPAAAPAATPTPGAPTLAAAPPAPAAQETSWREQLKDEKHKNVAERFTHVSDAIQAIIDLRADNSQRVKVPGEGATPEEVAKFNKVLGVHEKPEGYDYKPPEGITLSELDKQVIEAIRPHAHKTGLPAKTFQEFTSTLLNFSSDLQKQAVAKIQEFGQTSEAELKKEWGADFDPNLEMAHRVVGSYGGDQFKDFLNKTPIVGGGMLGDHPAMVRFLATVGRQIGEGDLMLGPTPQTAQNIQSEIDALNKAVPVGSPDYLKKDHQDKLQSLYGKLHGAQPIVGSSGRAA